MVHYISTQEAPKAIGPYSQAIQFGKLLFLSGQIPLDPESGEVVAGGIVEQTRQSLKNIGAILCAAGADYGSILKTTCFLSDMKDFAAFNEVYAQSITNNPARSCVAVKGLPKGVLVEIEVVAALED